MRTIYANDIGILEIGRQDENNRTTVIFDCGDVASEYPNGTAVLRVQSPGSDDWTNAVANYDSETKQLKWIVKAGDLLHDGIGKAQVFFYDGDTVCAEKIWRTIVGESLHGTGSDPPEWHNVRNEIELFYVNSSIKADEAKEYAISAKESAGYAVSAKEAIETALDVRLNVNAYTSISKIEKYLYEIVYDDLDYDFAYEWFKTYYPDSISGCSSIRVGNLYGRNYDWIYNESSEFIVRLNHIAGIKKSISVSASLKDLTDDFVSSGSYSPLYKAVPFMAVDGINEDGLVINENILPMESDNAPTTGTIPLLEERKKLCSLMLPRFILDHFSSIDDAYNYLKNYVSVYVPSSVHDLGYETMYMIADKNSTAVIRLINNEIKMDYVSQDKAPFKMRDVLTNFDSTVANRDLNDGYLVYTPEKNEGTCSTEGNLPLRSSGVERYNILSKFICEKSESVYSVSKSDIRAVMASVYYSNAYNFDTNMPWYSEFTGIDSLTIDSSVSEFRSNAKVNRVRSAYTNRSRDENDSNYGTWHTVHSAIYDMNKCVLYIIVQEGNCEHEFSLFDGAGGSEINDSVPGTDTTYSGAKIDQLNDSKVDKNQGVLNFGKFFYVGNDGILAPIDLEDVEITSDKLRTSRSISIKGDAFGSTEFDGSKNVEINTSVHVMTNEELEEILNA